MLQGRRRISAQPPALRSQSGSIMKVVRACDCLSGGSVGPGTFGLRSLVLDRYGLSLETRGRECWDNVSGRLPSVETRRYLMLYAFARDQMPCELWSIDVHERGLDGRADGLYRLGDAIGLDFKAQAVMITQGDTACALLDAVEAIEAHGLREFSFACRSGLRVLVVANGGLVVSW